MVTLVNHGGHCCGAQHIYGFGSEDRPTNLVELQTHVASRDPCLHEVILNAHQCRNSPRLLAKLAEMGFVLTTGFVNGNHDSSVYVFHRAGQRLALNNLGFNWNGQIASPTLRGRLTRIPHPTGANAVPTYPRGAGVETRYIRTGDRFTYYNPSNELHGATLERTIEEPVNQYASEVTLTAVASGRVYRRSVNTLRWLSQAAVPAPNVAPIEGQLHEEDAPTRPAAAVVVHQTFHNVFRDGRVGPGYLTLEEATNGAPRVRVRQRQDIYSDGRTEFVTLP